MPRSTANKANQFHFDGFDSPNGTIVPDLFFDELMPRLKDAELRVLLYIIRRTFGFKKNADPISFNQFLNGITAKDGRQLDRGCGLKSPTHLSTALKSLVTMGVIEATKGLDERGGKQTTVYSLRFRKDQQKQGGTTQEVVGGTTNSVGGVLPNGYIQQTVKQETDINHSNIREDSSQKNEETDDPGSRLTQPEQGRSQPVPASASVVSPPRLNRSYLSAARAKNQPQTHGLASIASILPQPPQPPKRTYTEERQVLVEVIADLAREFRDEATLTESVSRAYNLMQQAKISDIGVFTSKIYQARSITKERYGTIKRRMPYFFSVLQDICRLKQKTTMQNPPSG